MPIYEYRCVKHGDFELLHAVPLVRGPRFCPRCGLSSRPLISKGVRVGGFRPYEEWNLRHEGPVRITSASQLDKECESRGLSVKSGGGQSRLAQRHLEEYHSGVQKSIERKKR